MLARLGHIQFTFGRRARLALAITLSILWIVGASIGYYLWVVAMAMRAIFSREFWSHAHWCFDGPAYDHKAYLACVAEGDRQMHAPTYGPWIVIVLIALGPVALAWLTPYALRRIKSRH
ncbi:MAG: hypothetical protein HY243_00315 [Proteobacteria bacterium]|nr:hypothetical protein [Pseudomonadota bacterium]